MSNITIYISADLKAELAILPPRSVSRICQAALERAVRLEEKRRDMLISDALYEDL
jgi:electron transfer flavoprotein alpha/beta subunit